MALPNARIAIDRWVGVCCCHPPIPCIGTGGIIVRGLGTHKSGNLDNARFTDPILGDCGHGGIVTGYSTKVKSGNLGVATLAHSVGAGCIVSGEIVKAFPKHKVG